MNDFYKGIVVLSNKIKAERDESIQPQLTKEIREAIMVAASLGKHGVDILPVVKSHELQSIYEIDSVRGHFIDAGFRVDRRLNKDDMLVEEWILWSSK